MRLIGTTFPAGSVEVFRSPLGRTVITSRLHERSVNFFANAIDAASKFNDWGAVDDPLGRQQAGRFQLAGTEVHFRYFTFTNVSLKWETPNGEGKYRVLVVGLAGDI